jgi:acetyl-CoA carboxylase carboxyltransferase component
MVGKAYEHGGIAKDGAKLVMAVACAQVPKLTVVIGGSYGAGNYGMCGRAFGPRLLFMWPNARIAVMGPRQAAETLLTVRLDALQARGEEMDAATREAFVQPIVARYESESDASYSSARLWDDGVIEPRDTRRALALGLAAAARAPIPEPRFGVFRM